MKKIVSALLLAAMLVTMVPFAATAYEENEIASIEAALRSSANLAYGKTVIHPSTALDQGAGSAWTPSNLTDGSMNYNPTTHETTGYHSLFTDPGRQKNHEEWVGIDFGEPTEFDELVIYPNRPQDSDMVKTGGKSFSFPNAFRVEVSNNGTDWAAQVITVNGDHANAAETIYNFDPPSPEPITINFKAVTARYVRFVGVSLNFLAEGFYLKLTEIAVHNVGFEPQEYTYFENVVAGKPVSIDPADGSHEDDTSNWHLSNINNGTPYDLNTYSTNSDYGQFSGFHTRVNPSKVTDVSITFELGDGTTLNKVVIYPSTEKYATSRNASTFYFPANFTIEVLEGQKWITVVNETGFRVTEYKAIEFPLDRIYNASSLRFSMTGLTDYVKLSEIEAYDTTKQLTANKKDEEPAAPIVKENVNLAPGAAIIGSDVINSGNWNKANINNGTIEDDGGYTTVSGASDTALWVGYDFGAVTRMDRIVLYSAYSGKADDANWAGIPKQFKIQVSNDLFNWDTVKEVNNTTVPEYLRAYTYIFDAVDARYVRIIAVENYEKGSDSNKSYIQLAEMEVYYKNDVEIIGTEGKDYRLFYQTRMSEAEDAEEGARDYRFVIVATEAYIESLNSAGKDAYIQFVFVKDGDDKSGEAKITIAYSQIEATNNGVTTVYQAEDGSVIMGCIVMGVPEGYTLQSAQLVTTP